MTSHHVICFMTGINIGRHVNVLASYLHILFTLLSKETQKILIFDVNIYKFISLGRTITFIHLYFFLETPLYQKQCKVTLWWKYVFVVYLHLLKKYQGWCVLFGGMKVVIDKNSTLIKVCVSGSLGVIKGLWEMKLVIVFGTKTIVLWHIFGVSFLNKALFRVSLIHSTFFEGKQNTFALRHPTSPLSLLFLFLQGIKQKD